MEEKEETRLARAPTHRQTSKVSDQLTISFEIFSFRGGAPPYRGYHWNRDNELTIPISHSWDELSAHLKQLLDPDDRYDLSFAIGKSTPQGRHEMEITSSTPFSIEQALTEEGYHLRVYTPMRRGCVDIGTFVPVFFENLQSVDQKASLLHGKSFDSLQLEKLISSFDPTRPMCNMFIEHPPLNSLSSDALDKLKRHADQMYSKKLALQELEEEVDLQITLSREQLVDFIGQEALKDLDRLFEQKCNDIVLRRCNKKGHSIDFHVDYSNRTMQVAVVEDSDYDGGRLAYVVKPEDEVKLEIPERKKGSITIHDNGVIHGVTALESGVRYGLLVLDRGNRITSAN